MRNNRSKSFKIKEFIVMLLVYIISIYYVNINELIIFLIFIILGTYYLDHELPVYYLSLSLIDIIGVKPGMGIMLIDAVIRLFIIILMFSLKNQLNDKQVDINRLKNINSIMTNFSEICYIERDYSELINTIDQLKKNNVTDIDKYIEKNPDELHRFSNMSRIIAINKNTVDLFEGDNKEQVIDFINRKIDDKIDKENYMEFLRAFFYDYIKLNDKTRNSFVVTLKSNRKEILINTQLVGKAIYLTLIIDISKMYQTTKKLIVSEERFKLLFENSPTGILFHKSGKIVDINKKFAEMFDHTYEEAKQLIGESVYKLVPPSEHEKLEKIRELRIKGEGPDIYRTFGLRKDGLLIPLEIKGSNTMIDGELYTIIFGRDITDELDKELENERIQEKLIESHKLESLGILSGGLTHDFNNNLATIMGGLSLLLSSDNLTDDDRTIVNDIMYATKEASEVTNQLLTYTGKKKEKHTVINLVEYMEEIKGMIRLSIPNNIVIHYELNTENDIFIEINHSQLTQVIMNLVINASDAIDSNTGNIYISVDSVDLDLMLIDQGIDSKGYAILKITDDGKGIPQEAINKIFDPFYSSKPNGRGLGLSVVQGIIHQISGSIEVNSLEGKGTEISINIPFTDTKEEIEHTEKTVIKENFRGKILIIEDEEIIRTMLSRMLKKLGFEIETAENGKIGVEKFQYLINEITLIILDLTMPIMSGEESFHELIEIDPTIPIIISSGYSIDSVHKFSTYEYLDFLEKPYTINQLKQTIFKLLEYKKQRSL